MRVGLSYPRNLPAALLPGIARKLDEGGIDDLWVIEDCFFTSGPSLASAALVSTERLHVGTGILPAVVRHPAITAMEIATLCSLAPGRFTAGIGHGVQRWMAQIGLRPVSPLTALTETFDVIRRLLAGEEVGFEGTTTYLDAVKLDQPPPEMPPLYAGVFGPKSMALAGRIADGLIVAGEPASPGYVRWARNQTGRDADFPLVAFTAWLVTDDRAFARERMAPWLVAEIEDDGPAPRSLSFYDDLKDRVTDGGAAALVTAPDEWWHEMAPVGTPADAHAYFDRIEAAGIDAVSIFPAPMEEHVHDDVDGLIAVAGAR